ncbi:TolC family protein [Thiomicrorhabdus immobilis]|uniref:TolC family protein n=1 Tax=Thiomicrorhabdus immobilis TaxID=2791037 RepID=UPI001F01BD13|nr:TolC family protein [Thiomicrorhabdus immobilis]
MRKPSSQSKGMFLKLLPLSLLLIGQGYSIQGLAQEADNTPVLESQALSSSNGLPNSQLNSQPKPLGNPLPNPLTLSVLLENYANQSPEIALQLANIDMAKATLDNNQVGNRWQANIQGRLGQREFAEETQPHNLLALHVGKVIYDFDQADNQLQADSLSVEQQKVKLQLVENKQRLNVVKAYLNVLLADFQYRIDDEGMAVEYVGFDKVKDRHAIGQLSDVDLLSAEQKYQNALVKRMQAEQMQLKTRVELANTLGLPSERPDELRFPKLDSFKARSIKDVSLQALQAEVLANNQQLKVLEQAQQAQTYALQKAQNTSSPTVRADAWVGQLSSYPELREGSWKATLSVDIPLYDGGAESSATNQVQAQLAKLKAEQLQLQQALRTEVADIYFQLKLLDAEKKQHQVFGDYADLYLDYSRALYENESSTDLGDAMVRLSEANYAMVAWQFKQALLWLQLDYLQGKAVSLQAPKTTLASSDTNSTNNP